MSRSLVTVDALVVGAGPAGLAAATALKLGGTGTVLVVDREEEAGGIPRLCEHTGFGLRDFSLVEDDGGELLFFDRDNLVGAGQLAALQGELRRNACIDFLSFVEKVVA